MIVADLGAAQLGHPAVALVMAIAAVTGPGELVVLIDDDSPAAPTLRAVLRERLDPGAIRGVTVTAAAADPDHAALRDALIEAVLADLVADVLLVAMSDDARPVAAQVVPVLAFVHMAPPALEIVGDRPTPAASPFLPLPRDGIDPTASAAGLRAAAHRLRDAAAACRDQMPAVAEPSPPTARPRLALVSPLAGGPRGRGFGDPAFLRALARWYAIDVVTDRVPAIDQRSAAGWGVVAVETFRRNAQSYDRVLHGMADTAEHAATLPLATAVPGVIVLQDFAVSRALAGSGRAALAEGLRDSHGYGAVRRLDEADGIAAAVARWPANLAVLQTAEGVIVHDAGTARQAEAWYGAGASHGWVVLPPPAATDGSAGPDAALAGWAARHAAAIESFRRRRETMLSRVPVRAGTGRGAVDPARLAEMLAANLPPRPRLRQLLVDVSVLVRTDMHTGIQRVVRSILREWLIRPPPGWIVEPVRGLPDGAGYAYARRWTAAFLGLAEGSWADATADAWSGDLFLGLDLAGDAVTANRAWLDGWARRGVDVHFVVYDLLPILMPQHFDPGVVARYRAWLDVVLQHRGAVCISQSVAADLTAEVARSGRTASLPLLIRSFRLGADIGSAGPGDSFPDGGAALLGAMRRQPSFLMVGTVEPRKGHALALAAFELLWGAGTDAMLVIAGRQGWRMASLCETLRRHPEAGRRLHWLDDADDAFLGRLYGAAGCLLAASEGEGYGLPLVEAARHGLPILARDIPVFREVAEGHAMFFDAGSPRAVADAVQGWLRLRAAGRHPPSAAIRAVTWAESAASLLKALDIGGDF